jgi:hypothetical protein
VHAKIHREHFFVANIFLPQHDFSECVNKQNQPRWVLAHALRWEREDCSPPRVDNRSTHAIEKGCQHALIVKGGVELAKGGDSSSFLSAIISILERRDSHDRVSHQFPLFFHGQFPLFFFKWVEQAVLLFFCPKELFF